MPNQRTQFWLALCQAILHDIPFCRINPAAPVIRRSTFTPLSPHDLVVSYKSPGRGHESHDSAKAIDAYQKQLELV